MTSQLLQRHTALPRAQKFLCALCSETCLGFSYHSTKFGGEHKKTVLSTKKLCSAQKNCARYRKIVLSTKKLCSVQKNCARYRKIVLCQIVCALRSIYRHFRPIMRAKNAHSTRAQKSCSTVCSATCLGFSG